MFDCISLENRNIIRCDVDSFFSNCFSLVSQTISVGKANRGQYHYYSELPMVLEVLTTYSIYNEKIPIVIPYLYCIGIYIDEENSINIYMRDFKELADFLERFYFTFLDSLVTTGNAYSILYTYDLRNFYLLHNKYANEFEDLFTVNGDPAYFRFNKCEFRCMKVYSNLPSEKIFIGDKTSIYTKNIKTPKTELNEKHYEYMDFRICCLLDFMGYMISIHTKFKSNDEGKVSNIPITQIRYVKNKLRRYCYNKFNNIRDSLVQINSIEELDLLNYLPTGGICCYSDEYVGKLVENVTIYDIVSAHPDAIYSSDRFPVAFETYKPEVTGLEYFNLIKEKAVYGYIIIKGIRHRKNCPYFKMPVLDKKIHGSNIILNDHKYLVSADDITLALTDCDFEMLRNFYEIDKIKAKDIYIYKRGRLPNQLVECLCTFFYDKCMEKGTKWGSLAKVGVNSIYGILDIKPDKSYNKFDGETVSNSCLTVDERIEVLYKYNKNISEGEAISCYQWGIYVAGITRMRLSYIIKKAVDMNIWVYSDTDSVIVKYNKDFDKLIYDYNTKVFNYRNSIKRTKKCNFVCKIPKNNNKFEWKIMGTLERKTNITYFKVVARKEYMYLQQKCVGINSFNEFVYESELTVKMAGVSISKVKEYLLFNTNYYKEVFDKFNEDLEIPDAKPCLCKFTDIHEEIEDYRGNKYHYDVDKNYMKVYNPFSFKALKEHSFGGLI